MQSEDSTLRGDLFTTLDRNLKCVIVATLSIFIIGGCNDLFVVMQVLYYKCFPIVQFREAAAQVSKCSQYLHALLGCGDEDEEGERT